MMHGQSSQRGILFADDALTGDNAVYCWLEEGEVQCLTGPVDEVNALFKSEMKADYCARAEKTKNRLMLVAVAVMVAIVAAVVVFDGRVSAVGAAVFFAVVGIFPLLVMMFMNVNSYEGAALRARHRRIHGAEHAALALRRRYGDRTKDLFTDGIPIDRMRACSHIDPECGTVYAGSLLLWAAIVALAIASFCELGVLRFVGVALGSAVVLALNTWFNPLNPLKLIQLRAVAKPGDEELLLAATAMREMLRLEEARS